MDEMELKSRIRKVRYRSYRHQAGKTAPNIIARNFRAEAPNRKWATDVTQINIGPSKLYLSPIIDLFNGEIISYNLSETPNMEQIYDMLDKAFSRPRLAIPALRLPPTARRAQRGPKHVTQGQLPGQRHGRELLRHHEVRAALCRKLRIP